MSLGLAAESGIALLWSPVRTRRSPEVVRICKRRAEAVASPALPTLPRRTDPGLDERNSPPDGVGYSHLGGVEQVCIQGARERRGRPCGVAAIAFAEIG